MSRLRVPAQHLQTRAAAAAPPSRDRWRPTGETRGASKGPKAQRAQCDDATGFGWSQPRARAAAAQILAVDDYVSFKQMMVKRNMELELEARDAPEMRQRWRGDLHPQPAAEPTIGVLSLGKWPSARETRGSLAARRR